MNRFYIEKMVVSGSGHKDSIIDFKLGLNLIIGPSNTGKSLVVDCLDYVFGFTPKPDHPSKIVDNNNGYEKITLHLRTNSGTVILERKIGDSKISVSGTDTTIEHDTYSTSNSAKKSINTVFLQLIGIDEPHKILSSESGNTQSLTWRSILHLFLMRQADIARESSALKAPGSFGKTASPAALLYLLTGQDADNLEKLENPEVSKAKRKALTDYIRDKAERSSKRREELEGILLNTGTPDLQDAINNIQQEIDTLQKELDAASSESKKLMSQIYMQNGKLSECNTVVHNFSVLRKQYQSDIRRLGFIVNGKISVSGLATKKHCPFCDSEMKSAPNPQYITASAAELDKIKRHLSELEEAQKDIEKQRKIVVDTLSALEQQKKEVDTLISEKLYPQLTAFKEQLDGHLRLMRFAGELEAVRQNEARLNMTNFDIEIGGLTKAVSMGGGFCGILNTITALAMSSYLIEQNCKAPGFFAADSPLTQLSEADHIEQGNTIKLNFIQYLIKHASERQVIIIEQKKRMPFIPQEDSEKNIHVIEFSRNKLSGRYGFLNDFYNPEDK